MNWNTIRVLLSHELLMLVRDRRTVILSLVLPVIIMPLMLFGTRYVHQRRAKTLEETTYKYAVTGSYADNAREFVKRARGIIVRSPETARKEDEAALAKFKFEEIRVENPEARLQSKEIQFYLEALAGGEADALARKSEQEKKPEATDGDGRQRASRREEPRRLAGVPLILIHFQGDRDASQAGQRRMQQLLVVARNSSRDELLREHGFPAQPKQVVAVESTSLATAGQVTGSFVGRILTFLLIMLMLSGGSVAAMDSIAGEKERGSLETLLTTAARRSEIVAAKQLAILVVAFTITLIQVANVLLYLNLRVIELPKDFIIEAPPATIFALLLLFTPVAILVASILLMVSAYAKTYKEAQSYFFPIYLVCSFAALASVLPGVSLRSAIVIVPLANVSVAVRELMVGKYDWPMIFVTFAVMAAASAWMALGSTRMLSMERLITASEADAADLAGGPALFPKHVLRWYALMWAIIFAVAANVPQLAGFRRQLLFNELVIFLGGTVLMIWKYRLNVREALALRPVKPVVWMATILAVPSGHLVALGVFRLANLFLPVPEQMLEQFSRNLVPRDMPTWELFLWISVLPGICEEIGFRGTLLYGLRRRFHPAMLSVVVGIIFGLFHVALFRIIPTGFMGVILTATAILTGSIFPGMLAHAGNNAFGLWAGLHEFPLARLDSWLYFAALLVFALSMFIIYRNRTPYPGLRPMKTQRTTLPSG